MDKQLEFFKKDHIDWGNYQYAGFYKTLFDLKHKNQALWNGEHGGKLVKIPTGNDENIYAFVREKAGDKVVVVINLSAKKQAFKLTGNQHAGAFTEVFSNKKETLADGMAMELGAWEYRVFSN